MMFQDDLVRALPFDDRLELLQLTGAELRSVVTDVAHRSAERDCRWDAYVSGVGLVADCAQCRLGSIECVKDLWLSRCSGQHCVTTPVSDHERYSLATSGFIVESGRYPSLRPLASHGSWARNDAPARDLRGATEALLRSAPTCGTQCFSSPCGADTQLDAKPLPASACATQRCAHDWTEIVPIATCQAAHQLCGSLACPRRRAVRQDLHWVSRD